MMQMPPPQYCGMLKKVDHYARPPQACQDSPLPEQGRHVKTPAGVRASYVEDVCEPRMQLGPFFSFPLEGEA